MIITACHDRLLSETSGVNICIVMLLCFKFVKPLKNKRLRGATVARLTPDQKAACSNHVGVNKFLTFNLVEKTGLQHRPVNQQFQFN